VTFFSNSAIYPDMHLVLGSGINPAFQDIIVDIQEIRSPYNKDHNDNMEKFKAECHACMILYSLCDARSFENVPGLYRMILQNKKVRHLPFIVVGTKYDRKEDRVISTQEGEQLAKKLGCKYIEVSARNNRNVQNALFMLLRTVHTFTPKNPKKKNSCGPEYKIAVLGDCKVGKSLYCQRLIQGKFLYVSYEDEISCFRKGFNVDGLPVMNAKKQD